LIKIQVQELIISLVILEYMAI